MPANYRDILIEQQLLQMNHAIGNFLDSYGQHRGDPATQRTFIFFPGGQGSELVRADRRFDQPLPGGGLGGYATVWVDLEKVLLEQWALLLQMNADRDSDDRPMVAHGPLDNCVLHPYDDLVTWCTNNRLDMLMVGYDWRRDADWCVDFFLEHLVPEVRKQAAARGWKEDVFANAVLVGHSLGGMVVKWILNEHEDPFCQNLKLAITVATPFYGYTGVTEMLFKGNAQLGPFYDLDDITKTVATLPGSYSLFMLDEETWATYADALGKDTEFPLADYPSLDVQDGSQVDPYAFPADHPTNPHLGRYPTRDPNPAWPWFESYLSRGLSDYQRVAKPLAPSIADRLHNIRGVQASNGAVISDTKVGQRWGWYDVTRTHATQPHEVITTIGGPGDGVIPAWSARLVTQPADNIHTLRGDPAASPPFEHMMLMTHPSVQALLLQLIGRPVPRATAYTAAYAQRAPATADEFKQLWSDLHEILRTPAAGPAVDRVRRHLRAKPTAEHESLALRWLIEFAKGTPPTRR